MKKLPLLLFAAGTILLSSCRLSTIANIDTGIKVIDKCCNTLSGKRGCTFINSEEKKIEENDSAPALLPVYTWDSKQMLW